jgi:hypothetical protein
MEPSAGTRFEIGSFSGGADVHNDAHAGRATGPGRGKRGGW